MLLRLSIFGWNHLWGGYNANDAVGELMLKNINGLRNREHKNRPEGPEDFHNHILLFVIIMIVFLVVQWVNTPQELNNGEVKIETRNL